MNALMGQMEKLSLVDGDVVFLDARSFDVSSLAKADWSGLPRVLLIPIYPTGDQSVKDCMHKMSAEEYKAYIAL